MNTQSNYQQIEKEFDDATNQENYPEADELQEEDEDIDIDNDDSDAIPDGDDVDLNRAE